MRVFITKIKYKLHFNFVLFRDPIPTDNRKAFITFRTALEATASARNHNPRTTHWGAFKLISYWISKCLPARVCVWCVCGGCAGNRKRAGNSFAVCLGTHAAKIEAKSSRRGFQGDEIIMNLSCIHFHCVTLSPAHRQSGHAHFIAAPRFGLVPPMDPRR